MRRRTTTMKRFRAQAVIAALIVPAVVARHPDTPVPVIWMGCS
jgi:hypothetical protein